MCFDFFRIYYLPLDRNTPRLRVFIIYLIRARQKSLQASTVRQTKLDERVGRRGRRRISEKRNGRHKILTVTVFLR